MADETKTELNPQPDENEKKKKKRLILIIIFFLIIVAGVIIFIVIKDGKDTVPNDVEVSTDEDSGNDLQPDPNAGQYVEPTKQETEDSGVSVPGWSSLEIPANTSEVTVDFFNPEENAGKYSLTFELRLPDDSEQGYEVLYTSGLVDPGLHIQKITLSRGLEAGVYEAIIHVQPYRMDENKTPTNNADLKTKLIVS